MADGLKVWTAAGSTGTLSYADLAKVSFHGGIVQLGMDLPGAEVSTTARRSAPRQLDLTRPVERAVVRYGVVAVDGPNPFSDPLEHRYTLIIRYRGQVSARLMKVDVTRRTETEVLRFDSSVFPYTSVFRYEGATSDAALKYDSEGWDRVEMAYYVEATLAIPALALGEPAAIAALSLLVRSDAPTSQRRKGATSAVALIRRKEGKSS